MTNELATTNGTSVARTSTGLTLEQETELFNKLVLENDLVNFSNEQRVQLYKIVCHRVGLDPYSKPFDLLYIKGKAGTNGWPDIPDKLSLYANKTCSAQLTSIHKLSITIVDKSVMLGIFTVVARVLSADGTFVEDIGCTNIEGLKPDQTANKMMHAATKAKRRAVLSKCGLGMLDASEVEDIQHAEVIEMVIPPQLNDGEDDIIATWMAAIEGCETAETMTAVRNNIRGLTEGVRHGVKNTLAAHENRLKLRWTKDGYITFHA